MAPRKAPTAGLDDPRKRATRIRVKTLLDAVKDVSGIVQAKSTIPVLSHLLVSAGDGMITLTATDLDCQAVRECATDDRDGPNSKDWLESIRPFAVTLPAKALQSVLAEMDGDAMVTLTAGDDVTATTSGPVTITAGRARFRLHSLPTADFPRMAPALDGAGFAMGCSVLADCLARVDHAMSTEETRYYLNGVLVRPVGLDLHFAATDGHRLARLSIDAPDGAASFPEVIVGRLTVAALGKLLASAAKANEGAQVDILASASGNVLSFSMPATDGGSIELVAKMIDGTFPAYERVIPTNPPLAATIGRAALAEAVKRVGVLADGKTRIVKVEFADAVVRLTASCPDLGEASEELPCTFGGAAVTLGLDGKYWRDALGAIGADDVQMRFTDGEAPVRIEASGAVDSELALVQVVMPARV